MSTAWKDLTFRVQQTAFGDYGETLRTISSTDILKSAARPSGAAAQ